MALLDRTVATLRVGGDALIPAEITRLLGCEPTDAQAKGQQIVGARTGQVRVARVGLWRLEAADRNPGDLDAQIDELLGKVTTDLDVWGAIAAKFEMDL